MYDAKNKNEYWPIFNTWPLLNFTSTNFLKVDFQKTQKGTNDVKIPKKVQPFLTDPKKYD